MLKEENKKHEYWTLTKPIWKRILPNKQNIIYDMISMENWFLNYNELDGPLIDENKLQVDEKNKNWKI